MSHVVIKGSPSLKRIWNMGDIVAAFIMWLSTLIAYDCGNIASSQFILNSPPWAPAGNEPLAILTLPDPVSPFIEKLIIAGSTANVTRSPRPAKSRHTLWKYVAGCYSRFVKFRSEKYK